MGLIDRFNAKCGPRQESGCIPWQGTFLNSGYGSIRRGPARAGKLLAHRAAWILAHGEMPAGMHVLHNCDNKRCVNVEHLRLGTHSENMDDAMRRGQHPFARNAPPWTKLSDAAKREVIELRFAGWTQKRIAERFNVSRPLISLIVNGKHSSSQRMANGKGECHS